MEKIKPRVFLKREGREVARLDAEAEQVGNVVVSGHDQAGRAVGHVESDRDQSDPGHVGLEEDMIAVDWRIGPPTFAEGRVEAALLEVEHHGVRVADIAERRSAQAVEDTEAEFAEVAARRIPLEQGTFGMGHGAVTDHFDHTVVIEAIDDREFTRYVLDRQEARGLAVALVVVRGDVGFGRDAVADLARDQDPPGRGETLVRVLTVVEDEIAVTQIDEEAAVEPLDCCPDLGRDRLVEQGLDDGRAPLSLDEVDLEGRHHFGREAGQGGDANGHVPAGHHVLQLVRGRPASGEQGAVGESQNLGDVGLPCVSGYFLQPFGQPPRPEEAFLGQRGAVFTGGRVGHQFDHQMAPAVVLLGEEIAHPSGEFTQPAPVLGVDLAAVRQVDEDHDAVVVRLETEDTIHELEDPIRVQVFHPNAFWPRRGSEQRFTHGQPREP